MTRRTTRRLLLACALSIGAAVSSLEAQDGYRLPTDTLRYKETTRSTVTITTPQGPMLIRSLHDARIALRGAGRDSALAWYEALELAQEGPGPASAAPSTAALLGQPFVLHFPAKGHLTTRAVPAMPKEVAAVSDLSHQFDDFFISLPAGALVPGATWADSAEQTRATRPTDTFRGWHRRRYRVVRDTLVLGEKAVLIHVQQDIRLAASGPIEGQPLTAGTRLEGSDSGSAIFAPGRGRLLSRYRVGRLTGEFTMTGGPAPIAWPQTHEYTSSMGLQR